VTDCCCVQILSSQNCSPPNAEMAASELKDPARSKTPMLNRFYWYRASTFRAIAFQ